MENSLQVLHLVHSLDPQTGGVLSAVEILNQALLEAGVESRISDDRKAIPLNKQEWIIAHGLWQWPGRKAQQINNPYLVYPHGMLDPWFKTSYPIKHLKKQLYWWARQGKILRNAQAVCFTTEEERRLAQNTFFPYRCKELITGLGVSEPPPQKPAYTEEFYHRFPELKQRKILLYLGRLHPKKGVDNLIRAWKGRSHKQENETLVLAGPPDEQNSWVKKLNDLAADEPAIFWTGMLGGNLKWTALRLADALILPSHQENYGMVVAEACSVGLPVYLTDKVNLWRDVVDADAGVVQSDDPAGIQELVNQWTHADRGYASGAARKCFEQHLHIKRTAARLIKLIKDPAP